MKQQAKRLIRIFRKLDMHERAFTRAMKSRYPDDIAPFIELAETHGCSPKTAVEWAAGIIPTCKHCKSEPCNLSQGHGNSKYSDFCSRECYVAGGGSAKSARIRQTSLITKYGVENVSQLQTVKDKKAQTTFEHLGVTNPAQSTKVQRRMRRTMRKRYGVDNPSQSDELKERRRKTMQERFGVDNAFQSTELMEAYAHRLYNEYGVRHHTQIPGWSEQRAAKYFKEHGVRHHMHIPEIVEKVITAARTPKTIELQGRRFVCLGYEPQFLDYLVNKLGVKASDIETSLSILPHFKYWQGKRYYFPDIMFTYKGRHHLVEIKSEWTVTLKYTRAKFRAAQKWCKANNYTYSLVVMNNEGDILHIIRDYDKLKDLIRNSN